MKKIKITAISIIVALLIGLIPISLTPKVAYAAEGGVGGQGKGGNTAPTVTAVTLVESGSETEVTSMTPLSTYRVKVTAGDTNTIDDITEIEFHIYYSADGSNWDADALGIFKWTKSGDVWSRESGAYSTTWEVVSASSISPSVFTSNSGDWYLAFKPGKLAQATATQTWYASATARDENKNGSGSWATGSSMGAYAEIGFDSASLTLGDATAGIEPGQTGYITVPVSNYLTAQVTTNKQYALGVYSSANWTDGGSNIINLAGGTGVPAGSAQFNLEIDDQKATTNNGPKTPQAVASSDTTITGLGTLSRVTTNANASESTGNNQFWMALSFSLAGIQEVNYSGTITFSVTN
ncbi:MAG: hypothetical protein Q8O55_11700 [Dehalococcoidales bacterium]|nr:hypothetical protein [Dehalococcoidales bacterium]